MLYQGSEDVILGSGRSTQCSGEAIQASQRGTHRSGGVIHAVGGGIRAPVWKVRRGGLDYAHDAIVDSRITLVGRGAPSKAAAHGSRTSRTPRSTTACASAHVRRPWARHAATSIAS